MSLRVPVAARQKPSGTIDTQKWKAINEIVPFIQKSGSIVPFVVDHLILFEKCPGFSYVWTTSPSFCQKVLPHHMHFRLYFLLVVITGLSVLAAQAGTVQSITFAEILDRRSLPGTVSLDAVASSGLPVTYEVVSPAGVASVNGSTLTMSGSAGVVTVKVSQGGNTTYDPAPDVFRTFTVVDAAQGFVKVAAGSYHSLGIRADGTMWVWGEHKELYYVRHDIPHKVGTDTHWAAVSCGSYFSMALRDDGTLWAWGSNGKGQLGMGDKNDRYFPTQIGNAKNWISVACGDEHTLAIRDDGSLWAWGDNFQGQLGTGSQTGQSSPTQVGQASSWTTVDCGGFHTVAVRSDGTLWTWGRNDHGQLGNGSTQNQFSPGQVSTANDWVSADCGYIHSVARRSDGSLWAWGFNFYGQLGDGTGTDRKFPVRAGNLTNVRSYAAGAFHTVALQNDGTLWAWGQNSEGQLGDGSSFSRMHPVQVGNSASWTSVACGDYHTVAVRDSGTLWVWGDNAVYQLGLGTTGAERVPTRSLPLRGKQTVNFGALPPLSPGQFMALTATASSGLPVSYSATGPGVIQGTTLTATALGVVKIVARQSGDAAWEGAEATQYVGVETMSISFVSAASLSNQLLIYRNGGRTVMTSVTLTTSDGLGSIVPPFAAAVAGTDYEPLTTALVFEEGEYFKYVDLNLLPRSGKLPNRRFNATLSNPTNGASLGDIPTVEVRLLIPDDVRPDVTLVSPAATMKTLRSTGFYLVQGMAGDVNGIDYVDISHNGGQPFKAVLGGATDPKRVPWSLNVALPEGLNTLTITAYDLSGNSTTITRSFTFSLLYPFTLSRSVPLGSDPDDVGICMVSVSPGGVVADPSFAASNVFPRTTGVAPGTQVKLSAKPKKGYVFSHWEHFNVGLDPVFLGDVITFTTEPTEAGVRAVFIANPFIPPTGQSNAFYGLVRPDVNSATSHENVGFVTGTMTSSSGAFSGKIVIGGLSKPFVATFYGDGNSLFSVGAARTIILEFGIDRSLYMTFFEGEITVYASHITTSFGSLRRGIYSSSNKVKSALLNQGARGFYTMAIPAKVQTPAMNARAYPQGDGFCTLTLTNLGIVNCAGIMADDTPFIASSCLLSGDQAPIFSQSGIPGLLEPFLRTRVGESKPFSTLSGTLAFDPLQPTSDVISNDMLWTRPLSDSLVLYRLSSRFNHMGWSGGLSVGLIGALYDNKSALHKSLGLGVVNSTTGNGRLTLSSGKLTTDVAVSAFNIDGNRVAKIPISNSTFTLSATAATGMFGGAFTPNWSSPAKTKPTFKGIILQKGVEKGGYGFFISNREHDNQPESGRVTLTSAP